MADLWEPAFAKNQLMWGLAPTNSALLAAEHFVNKGAREVLIPGIGYGRNAKPFLERGMAVTGIEISETAISLARSQLGLSCPIYHGSVTDMPYDDQIYGGIFCFGLIYLLDAPGRAKLLQDCFRQLSPGGSMIFTVIAKEAPMYGRGVKLDEDWYETQPDMRLYFYDRESIQREFGSYGLLEFFPVNEAAVSGDSLPFIHIVCEKA